MQNGSKILVVGDVSTAKTTAVVPNKEYGIKGLPPEETIIIQCAGQGKEIPMKGWRKAYKANKPIKEGGNYLSGYNVDVINALFRWIPGNRKEIRNIVIDDADYMLGLQVLSSTDKFTYEDWRALATKVVGKVINFALNDPSMAHLNIIFNFHKQVDNTGEVGAAVAGKMISNYAKLEGLFSTVLYTKVETDPATQTNQYYYVTQNIPGYPAKTLPGCFDEILIKSDMGYVLDKINEYNNH